MFGAAACTVVLGVLMMPSVRADEPQPTAGAFADTGVPGVPSQPGYVQLGAALYPAPQPNVPVWTGATFITSHALAPHEMLYPHTYRALYPPYYHRVKGGYIWTPFGIKSHEKWELQGTMVQVKYRSKPPLFKGGIAPATSLWGGPWD
jgi:hypothetical protein